MGPPKSLPHTPEAAQGELPPLLLLPLQLLGQGLQRRQQGRHDVQRAAECLRLQRLHAGERRRAAGGWWKQQRSRQPVESSSCHTPGSQCSNRRLQLPLKSSQPSPTEYWRRSPGPQRVQQQQGSRQELGASQLGLFSRPWPPVRAKETSCSSHKGRHVGQHLHAQSQFHEWPACAACNAHEPHALTLPHI